MTRSIKIKQSSLDSVKITLNRQGFPSQRAFADALGISLSTVSNFLNCKAIDFVYFQEICEHLELNWQDIASNPSEIVERYLDNGQSFYCDGVLPLNSPYYLERVPIEAQIKQKLQQPGALVRIKGSKEMGKTSVLLRILNYTQQQLGYHTVRLNLAHQVEREILGDIKLFLRWFCSNVAHQLKLKRALQDYWDEELGCKISCSTYFQDYLLKEINKPLVIALDDLEYIFEYPQVAKDFLPLLRSWYEAAKTFPIWQKLRLVVVQSTEVYVPLDLNYSPFNVGLPIQLNNFNKEQIQQIAQSYSINLDSSQVEQLEEFTAGHPALVNMALFSLSHSQESLTELLSSSCSPKGIYFNHLQRHLQILREKPELFEALKTIMTSTEPVQVESLQGYKLNSMGLVNFQNNQVVPSCRIYRDFFLHNFVSLG
jgi:hypothetical protein